MPKVIGVDDELNWELGRFEDELHRWIKAGGDARLKDFAPLKAWKRVVDRMSKLEQQSRIRRNLQ
jgi:hypothetical protein